VALRSILQEKQHEKSPKRKKPAGQVVPQIKNKRHSYTLADVILEREFTYAVMVLKRRNDVVDA
jgi:hypothetical protein